MKNLILIIITLIIIISCSNENKKKVVNSDVIIDSVRIELVPNYEEPEQIKNSIEIKKLKYKLDSFLIENENIDIEFTLDSCIINENSSIKDLSDFERGIFDDIFYKKPDMLIKYHFFIPQISRILRIYLLEMTFENELKSRNYFKEIESQMNSLEEYIIEDDSGEPIEYIKKGLTGATDYILLTGNKVMWYNLSCEYSRKEFISLKNILHNCIVEPKIDSYIENYCNSYEYKSIKNGL